MANALVEHVVSLSTAVAPTVRLAEQAPLLASATPTMALEATTIIVAAPTIEVASMALQTYVS